MMKHDAGVALIGALLAMSLLLALSAAIVVTTASEAGIAASYRAGREAFYAANAAAELALSGAVFTDGAPSGIRLLEDRSSLDPEAVVASARAEAGSPSWAVLSYGPLESVLPTAAGRRSAAYVVVMTADDPGTVPPIRLIRAEAFGPHGAHRIVQIAWVAGEPSGLPRVLSWREVP